MENDILDSLEDIGYTGDLLQEDVLSRAIESGPQSMEYTGLVQFLTTELQQFCSIQEAAVNQITGPDDAANFLMELSGFLREYGCPYATLNDGPVTQRLATRESKIQLLDFLITELQACRMVASKNPSLLKPTTETTPSPSTGDQYESDTARHMKLMLMTLGFPKPPENITAFQLFSRVEGKLKELMGQYPNQIGKSLLKVRLSDKQWEHIHKINNILCEEYKTRRELLLKRLDVTVQSFMWSDKAKQNENKIAEMYQPIRRALKAVEEVGVAQILAARDDLIRIQRTSSGKHRELTQCAINKVLIPKVPDRGGRAWELEPPPPEMPSFMKRSDAPQGQRPQSARGGGGGGGRGRGGKVRGGWESNQGDSLGGNWSQGGGGYGNRPQTAGGDYYQGGGGYNQGGGGYNQGGGGGYNQGGYNQGGGGGYNQGGGGGYQGGGGGYQGGGGGYNQGGGRGGGGRGGYRDDYGGGRGGGHRGGGRGRGGRGGRGRN